MMSIYDSSQFVTAGSDWDARAEAQFEFSKFVKKFQSALETENPQTIADYKKVILQFLPEYRQTIDRLEPIIKSEFCRIASTSPEYPVDCSVLGESLPLPTSMPGTTPMSGSINNASVSCSHPQENNSLLALEISDFRIGCSTESDYINSSNMPKPIDETTTERAQERLVVGCESLKLLSNETQSMLKNMDNYIEKC
jgi:hypothetical protein